jgi:hypothetical protein
MRRKTSFSQRVVQYFLREDNGENPWYYLVVSVGVSIVMGIIVLLIRVLIS